jgi:CheY-like chemotaxis protein
MPGTIDVLCVDDNRFVADALREKLQLSKGFRWSGHMLDATGLLEKVKELQPHVLLLDIDMPGPDPFHALEQVTLNCPNVAVLILSGYMRPELIHRAIDAQWRSAHRSRGHQYAEYRACRSRRSRADVGYGELSRVETDRHDRRDLGQGQCAVSPGSSGRTSGRSLCAQTGRDVVPRSGEHIGTREPVRYSHRDRRRSLEQLPPRLQRPRSARGENDRPAGDTS